MHCIASIVKYIVYIFNIVFLICGILLITLGSIILADISSVTIPTTSYNAETVPIIITSIGGLIFVVSFFGCCGAIRENTFCTMIYSVVMFILFVLQLSLVIWVFVNYNDFVNAMSEVVVSSWYNNDAANGYPMNALQLSFNCCGLNGYADYANTQVPSSCCGTTSGQCPSSVYMTKPGCEAQFTEFWSNNMDIVGYTGIGIAVVEIVAFTFACFLLNSFRRSQRHNL